MRELKGGDMRANEGMLMKFISHQTSLQLNELLEPSGITGPQSRLLFFISEQPDPVTQKDIERAFSLKSSSVTSAMNYLERGGFIERRAHATDARSKVIAITPKGAELHSELLETFAAQRRKLLEGFTQQEIDQLGDYLLRMVRNLGGTTDGPHGHGGCDGGHHDGMRHGPCPR